MDQTGSRGMPVGIQQAARENSSIDLAQHDSQQIVGRERRERVSQLDSSGDA
jgi:hypothetical protein